MKNGICLKFAYLTGLLALLIKPFTALAQSDDYNIRIGDLLMDFSVYVEYAYDDNVTKVEEGVPDIIDPTIVGPRDDFILTFGADIGFDWQITDFNALTFTLGFGYRDYQDLNYLDTNETFFSINPESELDFTILAGPVEARIYDRFGYTVDGSNAALIEQVPGGGTVINDPELGDDLVAGEALRTQVDRYSGWENELGLELLTLLNPFEFTFGIRRLDIMPDDNGDFVESQGPTLQPDRWEFLRRNELIIDAQLYYPMGRNNGVGVVAAYSDNNYKRNVLSDSQGWYFGGVVDWTLGESTTVQVTAGYDYREFEESTTARFLSVSDLLSPEQLGQFADITEGSNFVYSVELLNLLGESFNHKISFTRAVGYGRTINEQLTTTLAYDFLFEGIRNVDFTGNFQWVTVDDSAIDPIFVDGVVGVNPFGEDYDLFFASLGLDFQITESLNSLLSYRYVDKNSDNENRSFEQSLASISLHYDF